MAKVSDAITLQQVFQSGLEAYRRARGSSMSHRVRQAAWAIMTCRTAARGGHKKICPNGHVLGVWYNSCLHRSCPQCGFQRFKEWVDSKIALLLPTPHFHLTFSLPDKLNPLWAYNRKVFGNLFFTVVADTLRETCRESRFIEGEPGFLLALHTWSRTLAVHLHIHCLVTAGGWSTTEGWKPARIREYLLPTEAIRATFGRKITAALRRALLADQLALPPGLSQAAALRLLRRLAKGPWIVDRRERYDHGRGVAAYVTRYLRGGPLRNRRLLAFDGESVTFQVSRHGEDLQTLTLPVPELIRRILEHVPVPGFRVLRGYGLYAHTAANKRQQARTSLPEPQPTSPSETEPLEPTPEPPETTCPVCGSCLQIRPFRPQLRGPPSPHAP